MAVDIIKLWIGGEQRPDNWYYSETIEEKDFIREIGKFIVNGAKMFYISIDLEHRNLLDALKKDGVQEVIPILIHIHSAQCKELEEVKEKIKNMGCMYGKLILL